MGGCGEVFFLSCLSFRGAVHSGPAAAGCPRVRDPVFGQLTWVGHYPNDP